MRIFFDSRTRHWKYYTVDILFDLFPAVSGLKKSDHHECHLILMTIKKAKAEDRDSLTHIRNVQIRKSNISEPHEFSFIDWPRNLRSGSGDCKKKVSGL